MTHSSSNFFLKESLVRTLLVKWNNNINYLLAKKEFVKVLSTQLFNLRVALPKIVFICGGHEDYCKNRGLLEKYFKKNLPRFITFRAEDAWNIIQQSNENANALELEAWLADFSDVIIILVESFGTVAELGAFSMNEKIRKKLLPILDLKYKNNLSFINTGPIKWINKDSNYRPSVFTEFSTILTCMGDIEEKINKRYWEENYVFQSNGKYNYSNKHFLFFYVYVLASLGPIDFSEIILITDQMLDFKNKKYIQLIISMGVALKIFQNNIINGIEYYTCVDYEKLFTSESTNSHLKRIQKTRARNIDSLLKIKEYRNILNEILKNG